MNGVSKMTICEEVALVTFHKIPNDLSLISEIFSEFSKAGINLDMISQTAPHGHFIDLSFTLPSKQLITVLELAGRFREKHSELKPMISNGNGKIQLYGEEMRVMHGVAASAIAAIEKTSVELALITTSEVDISLLVTQPHFSEAVEALENAFSVHAESGTD